MPDPLDNFSVEEITLAIDELNCLYNWLAESPSGEAYDLHGLDTALQVLVRVRDRLLRAGL